MMDENEDSQNNEDECIEVEYCKIKISKLIALNHLEMTVYNYN